MSSAGCAKMSPAAPPSRQQAPRLFGSDPRGALSLVVRYGYARERSTCASPLREVGKSDPEREGRPAQRAITRAGRVAQQRLAHDDPYSPRRRALYREEATPARRRNLGFPTAERLPSQSDNPASYAQSMRPRNRYARVGHSAYPLRSAPGCVESGGRRLAHVTCSWAIPAGREGSPDRLR
jgi:hypothetical protein